MICRLRNIILLSAAAVSAASQGPAPQAHQLDDTYSFAQYLSHFDKSYDDPKEYDRRSNIFAKNLQKILRHNVGKMTEAGDVIEGYVMGVNMFTDVETSELPMGYNKALHPAWRSQLLGGGVSSTERLLGAIDTNTESYSMPLDFVLKNVEDLPESMDWVKENIVNPAIPNQGSCGSCWTFAATAAVESALAKATGESPFTLSEQNMLQCTPNPDNCGGEGGCTGATVELGLNYIADMTSKKTGGMYSIEEVPYDANGGGECVDVTKDKKPSVGITGWTSLPTNSYKHVMNAVAQVGPVAIAVAASNWMMYEKGVFGTSGTTINHAVFLVGYGVDINIETKKTEKFWKVRNSWGPAFGEDGYIRIKRTDGDDTECQTDAEPLEGLACALDDNGKKLKVEPVQTCGTSGILFDVVYPVGVHLIE